MKCVCEKALLGEALANISRVIPGKSSIPALEGVQLKACGGLLTLTGYDMESGITTHISANVTEEGEIVLPARIFLDIIRKMVGEEASITVNERNITEVSGGSAIFNIPGIPSGEYPELPRIEQGEGIKIPQGALKSMLEQTLYAIAQTDANPVYTGSLFDIDGKRLSVVSVDGYRMAVREEFIEESKNIKFIVPGKALGEIEKLLRDDAEDPAYLLVSKSHIVFRIGSYSVVSRLLEGDFLDYKNSIPKSGDTVVIVNAREMTQGVERASLLISDRLRSPLRMVFGEDGFIKMSCSTPLGKSYDEVPCDLSGESFEIGFNNKYILDALKASGCDEIRMELNGSLSPVKILPPQGENFVFLVLPVRLKNDE